MDTDELPELKGVPERRPLRSPLAFEPVGTGPWGWASVAVFALGVTAAYVWLLSTGGRGHHDRGSLAPVGRILMALACLAAVIERILTHRLGIAPTVDERFSWNDFPERRVAYAALLAERRPAGLRWLRRGAAATVVLGWILYRSGV